MGTATKSLVKRNIAANVVGGGWSVALNLLAIPVQIRILGAEAYGLIGFVASLQSILVILDFGLPTTVIREIASDASPDRRESRALVQTSSTIYWLVALLVALGITAGADWVSRNWLLVETLSPEYVAGGIRIMALYVLFTWPLNIYSGTLTGLQRLELVNLLRVASVTAAQLGGILILLVLHDLYTFLIWLTLVALVNLVVHAWVSGRLLPGLSFRPGFSLPTIKRVWKFSFDMNLISTLAIVYTQTDRLLIGALLPLSYLGYYNVAYNVTRGLVTIQGFFSSAMLPTLASDQSRGDDGLLKQRYYKFAQVMVYLIALPSFVFMFFGREFLTLWATPATAANAYVTLALLTLGTLLNSVVAAPFILSVATGHSRIPLVVNLLGLVIYLPVLYFLTLMGGIQGAALTWVLLNLYYVIVQLPWTQRRTLHENSVDYLVRNFVPFLALSGLFWLGDHLLVSRTTPGSIGRWAAIIAVTLLSAFVGFFFLDKTTRNAILAIPSRVWASTTKMGVSK